MFSSRRFRFFGILFDFVESIALCLYFIFTFPFMVLSECSPIRFFRMVRVLLPMKLLSTAFRLRIDAKFGRYHKVISTLETLIAKMEDEVQYGSIETMEMRIALLCELYSRLVNTHLKTGNIDAAAGVIIRMNKVTTINRLENVNDLDIKAAHIIRAGIAASKLLEENGQTSLLIKNSDVQVSNSKRKSTRGTAIKVSQKTEETNKGEGARIIPFPAPSLF